MSARLVRALFACLMAASVGAQGKPRVRDLGVPLDGTPGPLDAITDVAGVEVGQTTLISGSGRLVVGQGPVRTGVTVIHPRGKANPDPVFGGWFTMNGNGEMTGTTWVEESGIVEGPIAITNTHSVGVVRDAILEWQVHRPGLQPWGLPVVAETWDGVLNDINGFHVKPAHVFAALDGAKSGPVQEGNVGGGTGMICHGFKGGIGTASRTLDVLGTRYTIGVLVQCNYGIRQELRIAGVPVGREIVGAVNCVASSDMTVHPSTPRCASDAPEPTHEDEMGSIIAVVATDAPLLPHQLKRIAKRVAIGIGRMGGYASNGSGDIFIAFSTANPRAASDTTTAHLTMLPNGALGGMFLATAQATEEAIVNALLAAETMTGADDTRVYALPLDQLRTIMAKYGRPLKP
jgi:D-aminopeptidase